MKLIQGYASPTESTVGNVGDLYTNLETGEVFRCTDIVIPKVDLGFVYAYHHHPDTIKYTWEAVGGSSSSDAPNPENDSSKGVYGIGDRMMNMEYHCEYNGQTFCKVSSDTPNRNLYTGSGGSDRILAVRYLYDSDSGNRFTVIHGYVYPYTIDIGYGLNCETESRLVGFVCTDDNACLGRGVYLECLGDGYGMEQDHQGTLAILPMPQNLTI